MMEAFAVVASGASLGFASIPHCIGMCGGIASACSRTRGSSLTYQGARLFAYVAIGAFAGLALGPVRAALPHGTWAIAFGAVTAAALVFSGVRLLRARPVPPAFVPVTALRRERARDRLVPLGFGLVTGLLPCGALYGALAVAGTAGSPALGALAMGAFGLASSIGLFAAQPITRFLARDGMRNGRRVVAALLFAGAVMVLVRALGRPGDEANCHASLPHDAVQMLAHEVDG